MTRLVVVAGRAAGARLEVEGELLLGRGAEGEGRLGDDEELSRSHARIAREASGHLVILDLGSTNGTWVNGQPVTAPRALDLGDVVELGQTRLEVREEPREEPAAGAAPPTAAGAPEGEAADGRGDRAIEENGRTPATDRIARTDTAAEPAPAEPAAAELLHGGRRLPVDSKGVAIGRHPDNDIVISAETASRHHARVDGHSVTDLGSGNGTYLNGERLRGESRPLSPGDTVSVGGELIRFLRGQRTSFGGDTVVTTEDVRVVAFQGDRLSMGRDPANDVVLEDPNVSRFHAEALRRGTAIELRDLDSRNGTRVNGQLTTRGVLEAGSEIGVGPFRLVFDGTDFVARDDRGALRLDAEEVTVRAKDRVILKGATLSVEPGEFVVIIGESGSGKSTLIKALAGVSRPASGTVAVSGEPVSERLTDIGYVPQDEIVHGLLTVEEALLYSARLRLPRDTSPADLRAAVERVLGELGLVEHRGTRIGALSGGQRKRAGVGVELLSRPSLLFLDEPTTGLDPGLESRMMELFRSLAADRSRAVVVVTHATKNLRLADKLVVMGRGGDLAFHGTPDEALEFFGVETYDDVYAALERRPAVEWRSEFERSRARRPSAEDEAYPATEQLGRAGTLAQPDAARTGRRRRARAIPQAGVLAARYARLMSRDRRNLLILLGQAPVIALGIALLFKGGVFESSGRGAAAAGRPGDGAQMLFLLVTAAVWLGAIDGSREIIKERSLSVREAAVGVRLGAYLFSKALVLFGVAFVQAMLLVAVVLALQPLDEGLRSYAAVIGILVLTSFVAVGMGLLISAVVSSLDQATSFIPLTLIPQLLFAGALVAVPRMTEGVAALSGAVFARWSFAAVGTAIDMNDRIAANRPVAAATGFGRDFFDVSAPLAALILGGFLVLFLGAVAFSLARRRG
ncbi:MAG: FHA domain-containing protein [Thermoleophilaceae bacterium]